MLLAEAMPRHVRGVPAVPLGLLRDSKFVARIATQVCRENCDAGLSRSVGEVFCYLPLGCFIMDSFVARDVHGRFCSPFMEVIMPSAIPVPVRHKIF
jgi:hypothetical protein